MKIMYIHGFNSAAYGDKIISLRKRFGSENVIAQNLPPEPFKAVELLEFIVDKLKDENFFLCGSSLGGFYALYLANKFKLTAILINPSTKPYVSLHNCIGKQINFKTTEEYEFKKEYLVYLKQIEVTGEDLQKLKEKLFIYLDEDDELLNSKETAGYFKDFYIKMFPGGNHRFAHMEELLTDFIGLMPNLKEN